MNPMSSFSAAVDRMSKTSTSGEANKSDVAAQGHDFLARRCVQQPRGVVFTGGDRKPCGQNISPSIDVRVPNVAAVQAPEHRLALTGFRIAPERDIRVRPQPNTHNRQC